jgi:hypothetical protein
MIRHGRQNQWMLSGFLLLAAGCQDSAAPADPPFVANRTAIVAVEPKPKGDTTSPGRSSPSSRETRSSSTLPVAVEPARKPPPSRTGSARELTFDDIKFEMNKEEPFLRTMLTPEIEALDGENIRIRGFMYPSFQETGLTQFVLVRDNMECCFGPGAALYDCIYVEMEPGKSTNYFIRPVSVSGEFHIREWVLDGKHLAIYHMTATEVR